MHGSVTGVILAGGKSNRMGENKLFLDLGGKMVVEWVLDVFTSLFARVVIITNDPTPFTRFGLPIKPDIIRGIGTLGGIHAGLYHSTTDAAFFTAADMPFIEPRLIEYMISVREDTDAVVPYLRGEYEPLLALYSKQCLTEVQREIDTGKRRAVSFLDNMRVRLVGEVEVRAVDSELCSIFNINTPADYRKARQLVEGTAH